MALNLTYNMQFSDCTNNTYQIRIYTQTVVQTPVELLMQADSVQIEYSSETLFDPLRCSKATINLLVEDIRPDLFAGGNHDVYVEIDKNSSIFWMGYVTPNVYSQPYQQKYDSLSLECVDFISDLSNYKYTYTTNDKSKLTSLLDVISHCLSKTDVNHNITKLYCDANISYDNNNRILETLSIFERNFFDEKDEPEQCDEVIKSILRYLGLTLVQYKDAFYIIRMGENLYSNYSLLYYTYSNNAWTYNSTTTFSFSIQTTDEIGLGDSGCNISMDSVYNKVTVIANSNPQDDILPKFDDSSDLKNQNSNPNHYETSTFTFDNETYTLLNGYFDSKNNWDATVNLPGMTQTSNVAKWDTVNYGWNYIPEVTNANLYDNGNANLFCGYNYGIVWQKTNEYKTVEGEPATLSWKTYLSFWDMGWSDYITKNQYISLKPSNTMAVEGGYLIASMKFRLSSQYRANSVLKSLNRQSEYMGRVYQDGNTFPEYILWPAKIKIGNKFYNGEEWLDQTEYNQKEAYWLATYYGWSIDYVNSHTYYRIWNSTINDWDYVSETTYNSYSGTKETGQTGTPSYGLYRYDESNNTIIYVPSDFVQQIVYGQYCYLSSKNTIGEYIFDTEKSLINTVSYKMNLTDAREGIAIPLPVDSITYGQLTFELHPPYTISNFLGINDVLNTPVQITTDITSEKYTICTAIHISDLKITYSKQNINLDIYNLNDEDKDVTYTNVINDSFSAQMDDVELKVNTYNEEISSFSYIIYKNGNTIQFIRTLNFNGTELKPEYNIISNLINHYSSPKIQYVNIVMNRKLSTGTEVFPFHPIKETIGGQLKHLVTTSAIYDLHSNTVNISTMEV